MQKGGSCETKMVIERFCAFHSSDCGVMRLSNNSIQQVRLFSIRDVDKALNALQSFVQEDNSFITSNSFRAIAIYVNRNCSEGFSGMLRNFLSAFLCNSSNVSRKPYKFFI